MSGCYVVITSCILFRLDNEAYESRKCAGLILDETQFLKKHLTDSSQLLRSFPAPFKLVSTGTRMQSNPMELWWLFATTATEPLPLST